MKINKYHELRQKAFTADDRLRLCSLKKYALNNPLREEDMPKCPQDMPKYLTSYAMRTRNDLGILFVCEIYPDDVRYHHASISHLSRYPTWDEMVALRSFLFEDDMLVVQIFPPVNDYLNLHKNCFHLWHRVGGTDYAPVAVSDHH